MTDDLVRPGDRISIRALKADGQPYRWWRATVEWIDQDHVTTLNRIGDLVEGEGEDEGWSYKQHSRNIYWFGRPYNLAEVYERDGRLKQLYVHIASMPTLEDRTLVYVDHELDVVRRRGQTPRVTDQDEFEAAAARYGYSAEFRAACWRAVEEAMELVMRWRVKGMPRPWR